MSIDEAQCEVVVETRQPEQQVAYDDLALVQFLGSAGPGSRKRLVPA